MKLYLNLKQSIIELFKTPAHYLKELTGKHSLFEKPYLGGDYQQMHLNLPVPTWKRPEGEGGGPSLWPPGSTKFFVIFGEGICWLGTINGSCGEAISVSGSIALVPPGSLDRSYKWLVVSSDPTGAQITGIDYSFAGLSASIQIQIGDNFTGTVTICARAAMVSGSALEELRYDVPPLAIGGIVKKLVEWTPSWTYALRNLLPYYVKRQVPSWDCGCVDLEVTCGCTGATWDSVVSAETIARSSSCIVAITDGGSGTKTWSVSGIGFWFDAGFTKKTYDTTNNSVTLYADASACGAATVTACEASGYVRCTAGVWNTVYNMPEIGCDAETATCLACDEFYLCGQFGYYDTAYEYFDPVHRARRDAQARGCCVVQGCAALNGIAWRGKTYMEMAHTSTRYSFGCLSAQNLPGFHGEIWECS